MLCLYEGCKNLGLDVRIMYYYFMSLSYDLYDTLVSMYGYVCMVYREHQTRGFGNPNLGASQVGIKADRL